MNRFEPVGSRRQIGRQPECAVRTRNRKEGMLDNANISEHPRMHIALEADKNLRTGKTPFVDLALRPLGEVEYMVIALLRRRVHVVERWIGISDLELLIHQDRKSVV